MEGEDVWGKRAKWMNLSGKVGDEKNFGSYSGPSAECALSHLLALQRIRPVCASTLGWKAASNGKEELNYKLPAGKSVTFRYRVVVTSGEAADNQLNAEADKFAAVK